MRVSARTGGRDRSASGGYTLIEVLIVMGLIGVVVSLLVPNFNKVIPDIKVDKAVQKVAADLRLARQTAITDMSYVRFLINPGSPGPTNGYSTEVWDRDYVSTGVPGEPVSDPLKLGSELVVDFDSLDPFTGITISSVASEVRFTPLGTLPTSLYAADVEIVLTHNSTGYSRTVRITVPLGSVEVVQ